MVDSREHLENLQAEIEFSSVVFGQKRYEKNTKRAGMSNSVGGRRIMTDHAEGEDNVVQAFVKEINERRIALASGKAGRRAVALNYLVHVEAEQLAYITIRECIDAAAKHLTLNVIALSIGNCIADHVHLVRLEKNVPKAFQWIVEDLKRCTSDRHRTAVFRRIVAKHPEVEKLSWSKTDKLHIGTLLVEMMEDTTGLISVDRERDGANNTPIRITFTPEAEAWLTKANNQVYSPAHLPMVCPPNPWTTKRWTNSDGEEKFSVHGGYKTSAMWRQKFVKAHDRRAMDRLAEADLTDVLSAVNAIQATPWRISRGILQVARELKGAPGFAHLFGEPDDPLPPKPPESASKEEWKVWKRAASDVHSKNNRSRSKRVVSLEQMNIAGRFEEFERIYFPHRLDFRGRIYAMANFMSPQSDDMGKALLEFADGKPLGERGYYWLKVHTANVFGQDKLSYADRVKWVDEHIEDILDSGLNPLDGRMFWTSVTKKAWQCLAACREMAGAAIMGTDFVSHLPIAMDGSCSGLQHYSAALRDSVVAAEVNLIDREKPGDIYSVVAAKAQAFSNEVEVIPELTPVKDLWRDKVTRPMVKQPVMTLCYAATLRGWQEQIEKAIVKEKIDLAGINAKKAAMHLAQAVKVATDRVVVSAARGMEFLKSVTKMVNRAAAPVIWTAPNGFVVEQAYMKNKAKRVQVFFRGQPMKLSLSEPTNVIDPQRQAQSIAPNFVHSLDASHLMATVNCGELNGLHSWAMIHDSFGVHACDTDVLHEVVRETFIEQYSVDVFEKFRTEVIGRLQETHPRLVEKIPAVPDKGTLDIASVRDAAYFFS